MTEVIKLLQKENGFTLFLLRAENVNVVVSNMGCQIRSIYTKDLNGTWGDIILSPEDAEHPGEDAAYMGCIVGRVANRIRDGKFTLNGKEYQLAVNNGPNHLHGGIKGFNHKMFDWNLIENGVEFRCISPDGEEGYPGKVRLRVLYRLVDNEFSIQYDAVSDADTLLNITNHNYFNLNTELVGEGVMNHSLFVDADKYMPVDENCLVTGERRSVENTCFDFRTPSAIGAMMDKEDEQIKKAHGYDHAFILNNAEDCIRISDPISGRYVQMSTTEPMVHVYTGNYLSGGAVGKRGVVYPDYYGIALETEKCPDSIHVEEEPSAFLKKGKIWSSKTKYEFGVDYESL